MNRFFRMFLIGLAVAFLAGSTLCAEEPEVLGMPRESSLAKVQAAADKAQSDATDGKNRGDTSWMLISSALVLLMVPGLALFYGGMVRRKNILATMMQSYAALSVVGLYWIVAGYALAFGPSIIKIGDGGIVGWSWDLIFLKGVEPTDLLPGAGIPIYVHVIFQGMFAIITPALISGALAERIRFWPFCLFMIAWLTFVYCPLAHMVWAFDWYYLDPADPEKTALGTTAIGLLAKMGALDFAGGTVVHIAAGTSALAAALVLRKRMGYPEHAMHPNSMVLTLIGAGLLWFGWFGFNGGSAGACNPLAGSAFAATQVAAAAAGLSWMLVEWLKKGKPTALGLASGIVAGLVAVTPASGYVYMWGGAIIGLLAGVVCYFAVSLKTRFGYDDSLDAFGVHAVGGFLGAILTGLFCYAAINSAGADGFFAIKSLKSRPDAIKKELTPLKKEIDDAEKEATEASAKADEAKATAERASVKDVQQAEENAAKAAKTAEGTAAKVGRRKDKQTKLRNEFAVVAGVAEVRKLIDSGEAAKLGIAWSDEELKKLDAGTLKKYEKDGRGSLTQFFIQVKAAVIATLFAFLISLVLAFGIHAASGGNFTTDAKSEMEGLDQTEHGEVGFDFGGGVYDAVPTASTAEPKAAKVPPGGKRFDVIVEGIENGSLMKAWSELCVPSEDPIDPDFKAVYPYVTTVQGNRFRLRGGDPSTLSTHVQKLFQKKLGKPLKVRVEE